MGQTIAFRILEDKITSSTIRITGANIRTNGLIYPNNSFFFSYCNRIVL